MLAIVIAGVLVLGSSFVSEARGTPPAADTLSPSLGIVWSPPRSPGPALRALERIHDTGVMALRLLSLPPAAVLSRADTLGLTVFVDLPVSSISAAALGDSLLAARSSIDRVRALARRHSSLQAVGLARGADTSVPAACAELRRWADRLGTETDLRTYYVTPFRAETDRCRAAVDQVLIDLRGHSRPVERWKQWSPSTGIGALGTWVSPAAGEGLTVPHSPQYQARYLEKALRALLERDGPAPPVFVYRWRDSRSPLLPRRYGLHASDGSPRPALDVVRGFGRGTQRVFAFPSGIPPFNEPRGPLLLAWGLVLLLGGLYARNPFVRQTLPRYFLAHGFYRDAVRKGRDVGPAENLTLLLAVVVAVGIIGTLVGRIAAAQISTGYVLEVLPQTLAPPVALGLRHPALLGLVSGGGALVLLGTWGILLSLGARFTGSFSLAQSLMLITWPCWPVLPGLLITLVAATRPPVSPSVLGAVLLVGGLCTIVSTTVRIVLDYWAVSGLSVVWVIPLILPSPLVVLSTGVGYVVTEYQVPLSFLRHLLTRT